MKTRLLGIMTLITIVLSAPAFATIDSLWTSPSTYGYKGPLLNYSTNRAHYFYVLDSVAQRCRIYHADNFSQLYNFPLNCGVFTYVYSYYLNDVDGNGHPEVLVQDYRTTDYSVRIIDALAGTVVKSWSQTGYSYTVRWVGTTMGSTTLKLALDRANTSSPYPYPSVLLVYSLGITGVADGLAAPRPNTPGIQLEQNYPNPFCSSAIIEFNLNQAGHTTLKIYNQLGQEVARLVDQDLKAGKHVVRWEGVEASSGVYYYQLQTPEGTETKKLVLMR